MNKNLKNKVLRALIDNPETRKDDMILTAEIINNTELNISNGKKDYIIKICRNWSELGLPNIKTIERHRRKEQSLHPELIDRETELKRREEEKIYREEFK